MPEGSRAQPPKRLDRVLKSALGDVILRPWFDRAALKILISWYFPLSRAWAAAVAADGSAEQFFAALPARRRSDRLVPRILALVKRRQEALKSAEDAWFRAFFGSGPAHVQVETERISRAAQLMGLRSLFAPLHLEHPFPAVAWAIEDKASVERRHGERLRQPARAFLPRGGPESIEPSRGFINGDGVDGWLRFPAPVPAVGPQAWARVGTPLPQAQPRRGQQATLVFAHGIGMEPEYWGYQREPITGLLQSGIRVILPELPWHGRRRAPGTYGGEPILALGVGGLLDFLHAAVLEIGLLVAWARATRGGPVAVGGVSLGALTAQLVATVARQWPEEMRPDALFLVAPSQTLEAVTFEGSLSCGLGVPAALQAAGWTLEETTRWRSLLNPHGDPVMTPERVVVLLGVADDVTLAQGGEALVADWRVPSANVFRCDAGHFSTSLALSRDDAPLGRLLSLLSALG
ncbi:MAG: alpha/beta fold hydrolase [Defluviicoccus sp.]